MTENSNVQYFTHDQARDVRYHIKGLYEIDRQEKKEAFKKTAEYKALLKEQNESDYAKELQADREELLKNFDQINAIFVGLKANLGGEIALAMIRNFNRDHSYWRDEDKTKTYLNVITTKHLSRYSAMYAVENGTDRVAFEDSLGESISNYIKSRVSNRLEHAVEYYIHRNEIDAIVATMEVCDTSQAVDEVKKRLSFEDTNAVSVKEESENSNSDDGDAKCEAPMCEG